MSLGPAAAGDGQSACQAVTAYLASWIFDWFASSWVSWSLLLLLRIARSSACLCAVYHHHTIIIECAFCLSVYSLPRLCWWWCRAAGR